MNHEVCKHGTVLDGRKCLKCVQEEAEKRIDSMRDIQIREELLKRLIDEERGK